MSFRDLVLKPALVTACESFGFESPSEIQSAAIPRAILKEDVIGQGKSGMGKTAVFVLSVLHQLPDIDAELKTQAVVLVHTPELAYQVGKEFERFAKAVSEEIVVATIVDQDTREQVKALKEKVPHIVVGLPGRIHAMMTHKALDLSAVQHFVIDELDEMLQKLNMRSDVQSVFTKTPKEKQVILMTATLSDEAKEVAKKFTQNPAEVYVSENKDLNLDGLLQYHCVMKEDEKLTKLLEFLDVHQFNQAVIFTSSKMGRAQTLASVLDEQGFPAIALDGQGSVTSRLEKFKSFQSNEKPICVATDVAARGLDIQKCNIVVQYDMAEQADTYFHRIGRAGRFGTKGLCLTFVSHQKDVNILKEVNSRFEAPMNKYTDAIDSNMYMSG